MNTKKQQIRVYGTSWCGDCKRARNSLDKYKIDYQWIDIDKDLEGERFVLKTNNGMRIVPTILFPDNIILVEPTNTDLQKQLNLP
jgi:glutaredoxin